MSNPIGDQRYHELCEWIAGKKNPDGSLKRNPDGSIALGGIPINHEGTLDRTAIARELWNADRSAIKNSLRCRASIESFEKELGLQASERQMKGESTASQEQINKLRDTISKYEEKILLQGRSLKEAEKTIKSQAEQLRQFQEIHQVQVWSGRNIPAVPASDQRGEMPHD